MRVQHNLTLDLADTEIAEIPGTVIWQAMERVRSSAFPFRQKPPRLTRCDSLVRYGSRGPIRELDAIVRICFPCEVIVLVVRWYLRYRLGPSFGFVQIRMDHRCMQNYEFSGMLNAVTGVSSKISRIHGVLANVSSIVSSHYRIRMWLAARV